MMGWVVLTPNDHECRKGAGATLTFRLVIGLEDRYFGGIHSCCLLRNYPGDAIELFVVVLSRDSGLGETLQICRLKVSST